MPPKKIKSPNYARRNRERAPRYNVEKSPIVNVRTLKEDFYKTNNPAKRQEVVRRVESFKNGPHYAFVAGEMCLELAHTKNQSPQRSGSWLERAAENWDRTIERSKEVTHMVGRAGAQLALYDTHHSHIVEKAIPPTETLEADYKKFLEVILGQVTEFKGNPDRSERLSDIAGCLGEASINLLAMRFAINEGDGTWMALPSLLGQDMGNRIGEAANNSWDTSIFTQYDSDTPPQLTYKVQTKSRLRRREYRYEDDISVVHISPDLALSSAGNVKVVPVPLIPEECYMEAFCNDPARVNSAAKDLDARTDLLLNILG